MALDPYTYLTLSMRPGEPSRVGVSFHTVELRAHSCVGENGKPYFDLSTSEATVTVSTAGPVTDQDLTIARDLFNAAARYLADCERLHSAAKNEAA
ncbi:hypothetical protein ACFXJ8_38355 [Nonomuraea sp. NPDC059194]|uniref:hypothetical protein n=1 Tax=Nonomuraea sp. NPDC059194 TaxID=3346764 RepID=UPI003692D584